jgi:hypothetical protein
MEYVSIGVANSPETIRGSATRGPATCRRGVDAVGVGGSCLGQGGLVR